MADFFSPTASSNLERLAGHVPLGLVSSSGALGERSARLAEEFAELGIPAVDLRALGPGGSAPEGRHHTEQCTQELPAEAEVLDLFTGKRIQEL